MDTFTFFVHVSSEIVGIGTTITYIALLSGQNGIKIRLLSH